MLSAVIAPVPAGAQDEHDGNDTVEVARLWGEDRYGTSLAVAEEYAAFVDGSVETALLVSGRSWTDAVTAAPLAGSLEAPVLLTAAGGVTPGVKDFLVASGVTRIIAIGTADAVSDAALADLSSIDPEIERISASDPSATSVAVAEALGSPGPSPDGTGATVILTSAQNFADALVAGTFGARGGHPILLTPPDELDAGVADYIDEHAEHVIIMGGTAAVDDSVEQRLSAMGKRTTRLGGATRIETAVAAAEFIEGRYSSAPKCFDRATAGLATAWTPFDAFSAAPWLALRCAPLLLTSQDRLPAATEAYLQDTSSLYAFGGPAAISESVVNEITGTVTAGADAQRIAYTHDDGGISLVRADGTGAVRLSDEGAVNSWSPDGTRVLHSVSVRDDDASLPQLQLWVVDADGANRTKLTDNGRLLGWSPDGTKIAYTDDPFHQRASGSAHWFVSVDGSSHTKLTDSGSFISWSPDGTGILYSIRNRDDDGSTRSQLWTVDADGGRRTKLTDSGSFVSWSPDGTKIAYLGPGDPSVEYSPAVLWTVGVDGSGAMKLNAGFLGHDWVQVQLSPDWSKLVWVDLGGGDAGFPTSVVVADLEDSGDRGTPVANSYPYQNGLRIIGWSPDGSHVAFMVHEGFGSRDPNDPLGVGEGLWIVSSDGASRVQLQDQSVDQDHGSAPFTAWSPDGTKIVFSDGHGSSGSDRRLWLANADGTGRVQLSDGYSRSTPSGTAVWSPDGSRLAYVSNDGLDGVFPGLWVADANGAARQKIADGVGTFGWSSDGASIVYLLPSDTSEYWAGLQSGELWVANSDGGGQRRLAEGAHFASYWSP